MTSMDFFGHQERARKMSRWLVVLFVLAVVVIVGCIDLAAATLLGLADLERSDGWRWDLIFATSAISITVIASAMMYKSAQLRSGGGRKVALLLGGMPVQVDTQDPRERMLRNVVEEMSIASGVPVPEIFVLDGESGINAFAAGWNSPDAVVAVTRGCLEQLDRDELQGVIAHEFSHIFHGDMRLNIRLMGVLFGIVCIATVGRILVRSTSRPLRSSGRGKGGAGYIVLFGVALIVIGSIGVFFARLIQAAVSRQREFLADASAVQYSRNPRGIGLALAKIGGLTAQVVSPHAEEASHMLFADGMKRFFGGALATHPPIVERVERVLPGFRRQLASGGSMVSAAERTPVPTVAGVAMAAAPAALPRGGTITAAALFGAVGTPGHGHVEAARELMHELPLELAAAMREPRRAAAVVVALLLDADPARRQQQLAPLQQRDAATAHDAVVLSQLLAGTDVRLRLPLLELVVPALRATSPQERSQLRRDARAMAMTDGVLTPFEWCLLRTMERHVRLPDEPPIRAPGRPTALLRHLPAAAVVLSVLARVGASGDGGAAAFARAAAHLGLPDSLELVPPDRCGLDNLDAAVTDLATVSPLGKRNLVAACAEAAATDGVLTASEADLLRALAGLWDCPIPLVASSASAAIAHG